MVDGGFQRSLELCVANVRNIASNDQETLTMAVFEIYIYEIA